MNDNLQDAINTFNDSFSSNKTKITKEDLSVPKKDTDWMKYHMPDDENSFLKKQYMADFRFGWLSLKSEEEIKKIIKGFRDSGNFIRILNLWSNGQHDPLIFINDILCDGYHRAALAWHMGLEEYPVLLYKTKTSKLD